MKIATLDSTDLPVQFRYEVPAPIKRLKLIQTGGDVKTCVAPEQVFRDILIPWSVEAGSYDEWDWMRTKYVGDTGHSVYVFTGYWGDTFDVYLHELDKAKVRGRLFTFSGSFQIESVTSWGT